jgi:hypothetical protein
MLGVLADSELAPFTRLVGLRLGLSINMKDWPNTSLGTADHAIIAADIGMPVEKVSEAIAVLMDQNWLLSDHWCCPHSYNLWGGPPKDGGQS